MISLRTDSFVRSGWSVALCALSRLALGLGALVPRATSRTEPEPGQRPPKGARLRRKVKLPETM